jgi:proteic killer suppression protein
VIKSFRHKGIERFFETGSAAGIQPHHAGKLRLMLGSLDRARSEKDMNAAGWRLHGLSGKYQGFWSVTINGNWRLIFRFDGTDVEWVDYLDYH